MGIESLGQRITIKRIMTFLLTLSFLLVTSSNIFAYESAQEHNKLMKDILFGHYSITNKDGTNKLTALEYASFLCLDYTSKGGETELRFLNNTAKVKGIIKSIAEIKFNSNQYHRRYTHRGWNFKYYDDKAHWKLRKELMLNTVKKVFNYNDSKKCDAMASALYNIHVLGDYFDMDESQYETYKGNSSKDPLLMDLYSEGRNTECLLKSLKENFISLFSFQKKSIAYSSLINFEFEEIESALKTANDYKSFKEACNNLENALKRYVPELMRDNDAFRTAFYK